MSIEEEIDNCLRDGSLVRLRLFVPELPERRLIYVTPAVTALLHGPWGDVRWERRWYRARQAIDDFIDGLIKDRIYVRSAPRKKSTAFMSILDPEQDEVWEIRVRDPKPGLRIFGSFVQKDRFVALTAAPHECLNTEEDWNRAINEYKSEWSRHFRSQPFTGSYPHDYLTDAFILD